jgi:hypothetical protein
MSHLVDDPFPIAQNLEAQKLRADMNAERRVPSGRGPVTQEDYDNSLEIRSRYRERTAGSPEVWESLGM